MFVSLFFSPPLLPRVISSLLHPNAAAVSCRTGVPTVPGVHIPSSSFVSPGLSRAAGTAANAAVWWCFDSQNSMHGSHWELAVRWPLAHAADPHGAWTSA
eukprot:577130-Pyramimonas_sp.AAC.1